ncbi:hypothetical protein AvCA_17130 [Azotobacter vinelandii CA]|uniref:Uncharacterized protein n=2 Tax=Azotobacter vinelandii TaxID=354 RepID=C1DSH1_AZOVD|nr:hypothetical protein Avin_17130 [Azotobacter vinelandii DJ]AGK16929.1 hypothetical protein AvCA_17130 [Azotobacter vinelandii CA]AGK20090.1 hypothetical protein AvCA6_17130 [Azotobacter vinelandii CA6]
MKIGGKGAKEGPSATAETFHEGETPVTAAGADRSREKAA